MVNGELVMVIAGQLVGAWKPCGGSSWPMLAESPELPSVMSCSDRDLTVKLSTGVDFIIFLTSVARATGKALQGARGPRLLRSAPKRHAVCSAVLN